MQIIYESFEEILATTYGMDDDPEPLFDVDVFFGFGLSMSP
jgi:hypothetical protein